MTLIYMLLRILTLWLRTWGEGSLCCVTSPFPQSCEYFGLRQEQIFSYHRPESPIASIACPSQSILLRTCEASTGKNNVSLKSLTSETNRREREKWVFVSWKQNPYQKIGLGLVKAKPISCTLDLLYTQIQDSLS